MCNGKGKANNDGDSKKITIASFKSGKIIITGGQNTNQLVIAYTFIHKFITDHKDKVELIHNAS